jgi:pyrroloquinoline quinone (PQQ) biosynthesis protein C
MSEKLQDKIDELRDALENLVDEQNGPPLPTHARRWHRAMEVACKALGRKAGEKHHREAQEPCTSTTP